MVNNVKAHIRYIVYFVFFFLLTGCATAPVRETIAIRGPIYNIGEVPYVSLASVADAYNLKYEWDSISKRLTLYRGDKKVILCAGSYIALINNAPKNLKEPLRIHSGIIVFPRDFASTTLAEVFIKELKPRREEVILPGVYRIDKIVIDAGHGGKDPGAIGQFGVREKDITLDITKRLKYHLDTEGIKTVLTRSDDRFISLGKRAELANKEAADFFVSIHANTCPTKSVKGMEVYYLSEAIDDNARAVAASENASLKYENSSFSDTRPSNDLEVTLFDIQNTENRVESIELAKHITDSAHSRLGIKNRRVKAARFYVLKGAKTPSILIEVGFISNRDEAEKLRSSEYREMIAQAIAAGIMDYKERYERTEGFTR
jgi:N-acetylmuramoyl-L-alanine amidase